MCFKQTPGVTEPAAKRNKVGCEALRSGQWLISTAAALAAAQRAQEAGQRSRQGRKTAASEAPASIPHNDEQLEAAADAAFEFDQLLHTCDEQGDEPDGESLAALFRDEAEHGGPQPPSVVASIAVELSLIHI